MKPIAPLAWLALLVLANLTQAADLAPVAGHQTKSIEGWTLFVSDALLAKDQAAADEAITLLTVQLQEIIRVVPAPAVAELRKVPLWFSAEYAKVPPRAEYHPAAGWLRANGRDPAMAKAVEFTNIRIFARETKRMPNFTLHELAHAYHDRVLAKGFDNPELKTAYNSAKERGLYDRVEQRFGDGRSADVRAYAMTSPMEYFAECSEAFFSTNDFFPFSREQLAKHDPEISTLLSQLWQCATEQPAAEAKPVTALKVASQPAEQPAAAKPADQTKPIQVYIMLGQSNMLGFGRVGPKETKGSLEHLVKEKGKYPHLVDSAGKWITRQDVRYVHVMDQRGVDYKNMEKFGDVRNEWLTPNGSFGPELGFGQVVGDYHDEPVLLLKACIGNRSLGWDLLPPGSERFEFEGKIYAGYKDVANFWDKGAEPKPVPWYAGRQYDADTAHAKAVLKNLTKYYPGYQGQGFKVAGFVWWQGHKDQSPALAGRYEQNLVHLIKTLRKDFDAPDAKFVLATGCGNPGRESFGLQIAEAQLAVDGDKGKYPEFKGNVKSVDTRDLWREADVSPSNQGYHYNHNAETYYETGERLGQAVTSLLKGSK
ncbi:MAG: zinc-dependent peptidase [Pirellulaceae bacterium]|nr:zinc-dependent peptidase [Pirellulaceae bacterium]